MAFRFSSNDSLRFLSKLRPEKARQRIWSRNNFCELAISFVFETSAERVKLVLCLWREASKKYKKKKKKISEFPRKLIR